MKGPIQIKFGLSFLPTLQYSSTPKELAPIPAKPSNSDLAPRTRFVMLNKKRKTPLPERQWRLWFSGF
jgi:hypothetical protein